MKTLSIETMSQETMILLLMLGIKEEEYKAYLYELAEYWEDKHRLDGAFATDAVRGWFIDAANRMNRDFYQHITWSDGQFRYSKSDGRGNHEFIYCHGAIMKKFLKNLAPLRHMRLNSAVAEFIKSKHGKL